MAQEFALGSPDQIPKGEGRTFVVGAETVAVFHTRSGEVFAVQAMCPHKGGPLADGLVGDATVTCPLHDRSYDLRTGAGFGVEGALRRFPIRLAADGGMIVRLE